MIAAPPAQPRWRGKLILGGLLLYLLFLIIQMPVAWLFARMPDNSPIQLRQASGTPWNGAVRQVIWRAENDRIELGGLSWRWLPGELLNGRIGFNFTLGQSPRLLTGNLLLGRSGHALKNVQGRVDAALLGFASRPFGLLQPQGSLVLNIADLLLTPNRIHGAARIDWQDARSGLIAPPLGDYRAELNATPDARRARIEVHTLQGALALNGNAEYLPGKGVQGTLRLTPPQGEGGKVYHPLLDLLSRPDASGTWVLLFNPG